MANTTRLRIVTPTRELYNSDAEMVIMRASTGDMGVLPGHQPLTTTLGYGILRIKNGSEEEVMTMFGGFADVQPDGITILSDAAEWPDEIDEERALKAKERAEKRLAEHEAGIDTLRAELALRRALIRLDARRYNH